MPDIVDEIISQASTYTDRPDFIDYLFAERKQDVISGTPVVIFGAGKLAQEFHTTLKRCGIEPVAFCDNDPDKAGQSLADSLSSLSPICKRIIKTALSSSPPANMRQRSKRNCTNTILAKIKSYANLLNKTSIYGLSTCMQ